MNIDGAGRIPAVAPTRTAPAAAPQADAPAGGPTMGTDQLKLSTPAQTPQNGDQPAKTDAEKQADAEAQKEGYTDAEEKKTYDQINEKLQLSRLISKIEEALKDDDKK